MLDWFFGLKSLTFVWNFLLRLLLFWLIRLLFQRIWLLRRWVLLYIILFFNYWMLNLFWISDCWSWSLGFYCLRCRCRCRCRCLLWFHLFNHLTDSFSTFSLSWWNRCCNFCYFWLLLNYTLLFFLRLLLLDNFILFCLFCLQYATLFYCLCIFLLNFYSINLRLLLLLLWNIIFLSNV